MVEQENDKKRVLITAGANALLQGSGLMQTYEERTGAKIEIAQTGVDALTFINNESPDVVILEINVPVINGLDIAMRLQSDPMNRLIPVIFIARSGEEHLEEKCRESGGNVFITPPYTLDKLFSETASAMGVAVRREKRADVRMKVDSQHFKKGFAGESIDVSMSGILVSLNACTLETGYPVVLEFKPPSLETGIRSRGIVRRIHYRGSENRYEVGIEFKDMSVKYKKLLKELLDSQNPFDD